MELRSGFGFDFAVSGWDAGGPPLAVLVLLGLVLVLELPLTPDPDITLTQFGPRPPQHLPPPVWLQLLPPAMQARVSISIEDRIRARQA